VKRLTFTLTPKTAFATPLHGDTLFGQCCWAILHLHGEAKLTELLAGYTKNKPFMVVSDALPQGFITRPAMPAELLGFNSDDAKNRKEQKKAKWFPLSVLAKPLNEWGNEAKTDDEMVKTFFSEQEKEECKRKNQKPRYLISDEPQDHNSLNRLSGTTGTGDGFAPFQRQTFWYHPNVKLTLLVDLDENCFTINDLLDILQWVGETGYGKEASCGLGKFAVSLDNAIRPELVEGQAQANAWLTLAACAPQGLKWNSKNCYYQTFSRFGRHGDRAVHQGSPFKNPILMAAPFAVLTPEKMTPQHFTGQGLTGLSKTIEQTVHQGYAPVLPVLLGVKNE